MSVTVANITSIQAQYTGYFEEPVFGVLGNPANLYTNILRQFRQYGATANDLRTDLSVLAQANVTCSLPRGAGQVRVWLGRFEVYAPEVKTATQMIDLVRNATAALADTDASLVPKTHHMITVAAWAELAGTTFPKFIRQFVVTPDALTLWRPNLEFEHVRGGRVVGSVRLEAADNNPDHAYIRSSVELFQEFPTIEELGKTGLDQITAQLRALDLEMPIRYD